MEVVVRNQTGETVDSIELNDAVFNVPMNRTYTKGTGGRVPTTRRPAQRSQVVAGSLGFRSTLAGPGRGAPGRPSGGTAEWSSGRILEAIARHCPSE